jgi:hypothetical protein
MAAAPWIVSDELWELIEPLLPKKKRRFRYPGRKRLPDRQALQGILFVLHTGVAWQHLPAELGFGSGVTCWRRLDEWQRRGCGSGCTRSCSRACGRQARSSGRERSSTPARCRRKRGHRDGPEPGRQGPSRLQAPSPCRPVEAPARLRAHRLEPQRRHPADPSPRCSARGGRPCWPASASTGLRDRRPRLRPRQVPPAAPPARHQAGDRAQADRARLRSGALSLGRRAHLRLAAQLQAPARPLPSAAPTCTALCLACCLVCFRRLRSSI